MIIRAAEYQDLPEINEIGNQAIKDEFKTARLSEISESEREEWFSSCDRNKYSIFVAEDEGKIKGWVCLNPYRNGRESLEESAVISYFIHYDHHGKGIGTQLIDHLLSHLHESIRVIFAIIIEGNESSIRLLKKFHFEEWARLPQVYRLGSIIKDQVYLGKIMR